MTYETFLTEISDQIRRRLPASTEAHLRKVHKNNDQVYDGLVITDCASNVSPTIYVNQFYPRFQNHELSMEAITDIVLDQYEAARVDSSLDLSDFTQFEAMKDRIIFRIVNRSKNAALLETVPHVDYLDFAVTFLCLLSIHNNADATILIHNSHLTAWHTNVETLFRLAKTNTPRLLAWDLSSMQDILSELSMPEDDILPSSDELVCPMYVLTNRIRQHGAGCILYDNLLASFSEQFDDDFYIIPSSIHEVLLVPRAQIGSREELDSMIREVNATQVPDEDILSDHAYLFVREKNQIVY